MSHRYCFVAAALFSLSVVVNGNAIRSFNIAKDRFVLDGEPIQIKAGEIHYSRVPPEYWEDRLLRLKAMGLNSIQVYASKKR